MEDVLTPHRRAILETDVEELARLALEGWDIESYEMTPTGGTSIGVDVPAYLARKALEEVLEEGVERTTDR